MSIFVSPLSQVARQIALHRPTGVISLLDPDFLWSGLGPAYAGKHLQLRFHDLHIPAENHVLPSAQHVTHLLDFLAAFDSTETLLIHCRAGIGRSPAAAFIAACYLYPDVSEVPIALALRRASPHARPNETLIRLADTLLARRGRMTDAISRTGRNLPWPDVAEGEPFEMPCPYALGPP